MSDQLDPKVQAIVDKLLEDPNTEKLAESLEISLEDYISLVVHFVTTGQEPQLHVVKREELERHGLSTVSPESINTYIDGLVKAQEAAGVTGFAEAKKSLVASAELAQPDLKANPALQAELQKSLRGNRGGKS